MYRKCIGEDLHDISEDLWNDERERHYSLVEAYFGVHAPFRILHKGCGGNLVLQQHIDTSIPNRWKRQAVCESCRKSTYVLM